MNGHNLQRNHVSSRQVGRSQGSVQRPLTGLRSSSGARPTANVPPPLQDSMSQDEISKQMERTQKETHAHSEGDSDSSLPSPMREQFLSSDLEASGEESDPRPPQGKTEVWIVKRQGQKVRLYPFSWGGKFEESVVLKVKYLCEWMWGTGCRWIEKHKIILNSDSRNRNLTVCITIYKLSNQGPYL